MGAPISSKDLLAEAGYTEPKGTVTISAVIPRDKKIDLENLDPELYARIERMREDWKNDKAVSYTHLTLPTKRIV